MTRRVGSRSASSLNDVFTPPFPSLVVPVSISFSPTAPSVLDNTPAGQPVTGIIVTMSDASVFVGSLGFALPNGSDGNHFAIVQQGASSAIAVGTTALPLGTSTRNVTVSATQNSVTVSASLAISVLARPLSITFVPANPALLDNAIVGTLAATVNVNMSGGSPFTGNLIFGNPFFNDGGLFGISGSNIVTAALLPAGASTQSVTVTTINNPGGATAVTANLVVSVLARPLAIVVVTANPAMLDNAPAGTAISSIIVTMSGGGAFGGTLAFAAPNNNDGGRFALSGSILITGLTAVPAGNSTQTITLSASQNQITVTLNVNILVFAHPVSITFVPASPSILDSSPVNTQIAAITVTMSGGAAFNGTLGFAAPNNNDTGHFALSGLNVVTALALPAGSSTQSATIQATANGVSITADLHVIVTPSGSTGNTLTTVQLTSTTAGTNVVPFTFGVALAKGTTQGPISSNASAGSQAIIMRRWNDNSVKHAIISGQATLTANTPVTVNIIDQIGAAGVALTATNIQTANPQATVTLGGVAVTLASRLATPQRTFVSGAQMVECHYLATVPSGTAAGVLVYFHVRLYVNNQIWVRVSVEQGWADLTNIDKTYAAIVNIGGTQIFSATLTHFANSRWTQEGWIGGTPAVTPKHNMVDLVATKLVPNYFMATPTGATLSSFPVQTYVPYGSGNWTPTMGDTGVQDQIGILPRWDALTITSLGDVRVFNSTVANSKFLGSYGIVWRGSADNNLPVRPSIFPNFSIFGGTDAVGTGPLTWEVNHHGSGGYLAYILTGDYFHLETMQLQAAACYSVGNTGSYGTGTGKYMARQIRGRGWMLRTISQMAAIAPTGDAMLADYQTLLTSNASTDITTLQQVGFPQLGICNSAYNGGQGGAGRAGGWGSANPGVYPPGTGGGIDGLANTDGTCAAWMQDFVVQSWGAASDLEFGSATSMATWATVRDFLYKWPVGIMGVGDPTPGTGSYCFSYSNQYGFFVVNTTLPNFGDDNITDWYAKDWGTLFANPKNIPIGYTTCVNTLQGNTGDAAAPAGNLTLGSGVTAYGWGNRLPSLALAVDHAATGAAAAYNRLSGATNFSVLVNNTGGASGIPADFPQFCVQPRVSTIPPTDALAALLATMPTNSWAAVPRTTGSRLADVAYGQNAGDSATLTTAIAGSDGPSSEMLFWAGAALDTTNKRLFVCNGGHGNYHGNEAYLFDYTTLKWRNISKPTDPALSDGFQGGEFMSDGTPAIPHTYGDPTWDPSQNRVMFLGAGLWNGGGSNATYYINPSTMVRGQTGGTGGTNSWQRRADWGGNLGGNTQSNADYDPVSGHVWVWGLFSHTIEEYIPTSNTWVAHLDPSGGSADNVIGPPSHPNGFGCIQPGVRAVTTGDSQTYEISIASGSVGKVIKWATTGDHTAEGGNAPGIQWHTPSAKFVAWNGGTTVYIIDPGVKNWVAHTATAVGGLAANIPTAPAPNGTFSRFRYLPWANCFSVVNAFNEDVYIYKPNF